MCHVSRRAGSEGSTISTAQHRTALSSLHFAWLHQSSFFVNLVDFTDIAYNHHRSDDIQWYITINMEPQNKTSK